jgi:Putative Actinobacterial Holin-X, holin superfamily III
MKEDPDLIENLFKRVSELSLAHIELIKLKAIDKTTGFISSIFPDFIIGILLSVFVLFLNLSLAFWLGKVLGEIFYGFLVVSLFYLLLGLISHFFMRGWLKKAMTDYLIRQFFRQ